MFARNGERRKRRIVVVFHRRLFQARALSMEKRDDDTA